MGASLPPKEANLFKLIVKSYEAKQYKKGLKAADAILKKFPEHGETLAMKGLILNCMERKAEAYDLVRKGLKNDLKSHVCWHVYGLLYRSDREYREAIKCYRNALRIDPENIQILRDLSLLQAQMRDLVGFVETRRQLLTLKPNHRNNWIGFAIAHHLNGTPDMAVQILEAYEGTMEDENSFEKERENEREKERENERYEHSEMLLYKVSLLEEAKSLERAFEELDKKEQKIVDKLGVREQRASLLLELGRLEEAELVYRNLLDINPDNYGYYEGLQKCLGLSKDEGSVYTAEQSEKLSELYEQLQKKFPSSAAAKRIPLDFLERDAFYKAADEYIRPFLQKGVPSLFSDLRPLYQFPEKVDALEHLFLQVESSLRTTGTFPSSSQPEPPSVLMWLLYLLAQHYDRRRNFDKALEKIDEAIKHTPTAIDLYLVKGRILRHAGDAVAAANLADEARSMDLADRYLNSECVKRMLQADQIEKAEKTAVLFTKDGDQHNNLYDMQCIWYELASGDSHFRQGALGRALKKYLAVEKHYNDMVEDQFDFHTYCLRKMTLRAYIRMLRFQDHLHSHRFFHRAAVAIIRCYLKLYDSPPKTAAEEDEATAAGLSSAERKKMRQKLRKAEARAKKEAEEKAKEDETNVANKGGKKGSQTSKPVDTDPDGDKLLQLEDPLGEALKYLKLLQEHSPNSVETHLLAFEVYIRKQKLLLAFQAIKRQLRTHKQDPAVHLCMVRFFHIVDKLSEPKTLAETLVREVIAIERSSLRSFARNGLMEINQEFLDAHNASLQHRVAAAEALLILSPERKAQALKIVEDSINATNGGLELKQCISVHQLLESTFHDHEAALRWGSRCAEMFPYSTYFGGAKSSKGARIPVIAALNARVCHTDAANGIIENVEAVKIN